MLNTDSTHPRNFTQGHSGLPQFDVSACLLKADGQQDCWLSLFDAMTSKLATTEAELQQAIATQAQLAARCQQLEVELEESQVRNQALADAAHAQAQQFSETLRQLRQNQAQIIQAEKMSSLGRLVAGVAHEINNPVNFIYGNLSHAADYIQDLLHLLQVYQTYYPTPVAAVQAEIIATDLEFLADDLPKLLASMKLGAERIQQIVVSLRNFSRMDEAAVKQVDIHAGIDSSLMILQNQLKAKADYVAIAVEKNYGALPLVECFAGQLNQVFMNLITNAIDALEPLRIADPVNNYLLSPTISIRTEMVDEAHVRIAIADNGYGIPEHIQSRLFDPFFTTKPIGKGTGLGLSISYQIVTEKHGGILKCCSSPGLGATFVIEIPVRSQESVRYE
ncbi:MAG: ATP-binding protein [Leptolyngbyaceae cyanobacterium bins.302]|nr:ATP-binding protein [Leptolyngbyaceae cyanobacterium bins.302]